MNRRLLPLLLTLGLLARCNCADDAGNVDVPFCGDGIRNGTESCEGEDLGGATCKSEGFVGGRIFCLPDCTLDTGECSQTCGNGVIDSGEKCDDTNFSGEVCSTWGALHCDVTCALDRSHCVKDLLLAVRQRLGAATRPFVALGPRKDGATTYNELYVTTNNAPRFGIDLYKYSSDTGYPTNATRHVELTAAALEPAVIDLNGDGSADVAVVYEGQTTLELRLSGSSGFATKSVDLGCVPPSDAEALRGGVIWPVDLDGTGALDLVVACAVAPDKAISKVVVLRNAGGTFGAPVEVPLGGASKYVRLARNAANRWDLLVQRADRAAVAVFAQDGRGGFADSGVVLGLGAVSGDFAVGDVDGDGLRDLVAVQLSGLSVLIAGEGSTFTSQPVAGAPSGVVRLQLVDIDADGAPDIVAITDSALVAYRNVGGAFGSRSQSLPTGLTGSLFTTGDVDMDGDRDVVAAGSNAGRGEVVVLRNGVN